MHVTDIRCSALRQSRPVGLAVAIKNPLCALGRYSRPKEGGGFQKAALSQRPWFAGLSDKHTVPSYSRELQYLRIPETYINKIRI